MFSAYASFAAFLSAAGPRTSSSSRNALFDPVMALMGHREENVDESEERESPRDEASAEGKDYLPEHSESTPGPSVIEGGKDDGADTEAEPVAEPVLPAEEGEGEVKRQKDHTPSKVVDEVVTMTEDSGELKSDAEEPTAPPESMIQDADAGVVEPIKQLDEEGKAEEGSAELSESAESNLQVDQVILQHIDNAIKEEARNAVETQESMQELTVDRSTPKQEEVSSDSPAVNLIEHLETVGAITAESDYHTDSVNNSLSAELPSSAVPEIVSGQATEESNSNIVTILQESEPSTEDKVDAKDFKPSPVTNVSDSADAVLEVEKVKREMKMMETALQGAARQAQVCFVFSLFVWSIWTF